MNGASFATFSISWKLSSGLRNSGHSVQIKLRVMIFNVFNFEELSERIEVYAAIVRIFALLYFGLHFIMERKLHNPF